MSAELINATVDDIPALLQIEEEAQSRFYSPWSEEELSDLVGGLGAMYFIMSAGILVGSASVEHENEWAVLGSIIVRARYRNLGIGTEAFKARLALCEKQGYRNFRCHVHPDNEVSLRLHQHFGFVEVLRIENAFGDGEPRLRLELRR